MGDKIKKMDVSVAAKQPQWLEKPVRISEQKWPEGTQPVVSIFCITYNHEKFIRDAIEGFLMQETTFPVQIFIHDDASTDHTADIIKEYAEKYPSLFWTVLQTENQYSKTGFRFFFEHIRKQAGVFTALCEGDDFWIDPSKLQKQVKVLKKRVDCPASFHRCLVKELETGKSEIWPPKEKYLHEDTVGYKQILEKYLFHTSTMLIRSDVIKALPRTANQAGVGDIIMQLYPLQYGPWIFCEGIMSTFRRFPQSNFFHWDQRLLISALEIARKLDTGKSGKKLIKKKLTEEYYKTSIWRRSYNDPKEARRFFLKAILGDPFLLIKKYGFFNVLKQGFAAMLNLGQKHSYASFSKFKAKKQQS